MQHVDFRKKMRVDTIISEWDPPEVNVVPVSVSAVKSNYTSVDDSRRRFGRHFVSLVSPAFVFLHVGF